MMKHPAPGCDIGYVCSLRPVFLLSTYLRSTSPPPLPVMRTFPSPCIAHASSVTTHHRHSPMPTFPISLGCLVAIAGYCMTWNLFLENRYQPLLIRCGVRALTIRPLHICGQVIFRTVTQAGVHSPNQILGGSSAQRKEDKKYITTY